MPPPPSPDVASQMKSSQSHGGDLASLLGGGGMGMGAPMADITMKVMELEPLLNQMALQAPVLAPSVDQLLGEMKSRMGGMAAGLAALAGPGLGDAGAMGQMGAPPMGGAAPPDPMMAAPPPGPQPPGPVQGPPQGGPGGPIAMPPMPPTMGLMDIAMQLEVKLPSIGADDPTLLPNIQFFIAKMREEVPKVLDPSLDTQANKMLNNPAPTDATLRALPVVA